MPDSDRSAVLEILGGDYRFAGSDRVFECIACAVAQKQQIVATSGNTHCLNLAYQLAWLRKYMSEVDLVRLDGTGVRLGVAILGHKAPPRATWADFAWQLAAFAEPRGFTLFFLGGRPGIAEKAAARLREGHPSLQIVGTHHGYFDKTPGSPENEAVVQAINAVRPNILIVGFGMPIQERWLMENWDRIDANVALTGGAVFDYVSGELQRGPRWMTDHGLEWLARLIIEPRRLWKRYLIGNPLFLWRVLKQRFGLLRLPEDA